MKDQDEIYEAATETPASLGCPSLVPGTVVVHDEPGVDNAELQRKGASLKASNDRMYAKMVRIAELANECVLKTTHGEYAPGQYGQDYRAFGKAMGEIRELVGKSIADVAPDYEMLARELTRDCFDADRLAKAIEAEASKRPIDYPTFYTTGWLAELAKKMQGEQQRKEARRKRKIVWKCYETKVDLCVMGKTQQNGKVYEVLISKRQVANISDTYAQCKVNGNGVLTCNFTGSAWMLKCILTAGMQALVNHKAMRKRDSRRNYAKREAAKQQAHDNKAKKGGEA